MSCSFRFSTPHKSNFKAIFSSSNRLRALSDAIVLLVVAATQDTKTPIARNRMEARARCSLPCRT